MKLGKTLLFVLCLVLVASIAQAKVIHGGKVAGDTVLIIPQTTIAPVIDGVVDPIWNLVDATWMEYCLPQSGNYPSDWSDISGWVKLLYDSHNLYGLYYVQDDVIDTTTAIDWQMDGVEFYIDANNTHTSTISVNQASSVAYQFNLRPAQNIDSVEGKTGAGVGKGLKYKWILDTASIHNGGPSGYFVEFSFPLDSIGFKNKTVPGTKVSVQFQLDDNDLTADGRIHVMNWWNSPNNTDYQTTQGWGNAVFSTDPAIDTKYVFLKTTTAPVIDGKRDAIWDLANQASMDYLLNQPLGNVLSNVNPQDNSWKFYGLYDDKYIYGLFTVYDDIIDTTTAVDWQMDGIEFYTDANNTHTSTISVNQASSLAYQLNLRPAQKIDSVQPAINKGLQYKWSLFGQGHENDTVFSSMSGWQLEFKYSLDSLGLGGATLGKIFSFQLQVDDNDLTTDNRVHVSNWWNSIANSDYQTTQYWGDAVLGPTIVTAVKAQKTSVASEYRLEQNYPNPFNPSTQITFTLAKSGIVKLAVYNILGQQVATLVNGTRNAGPQAVTFNASSLSSGVYFYKLEAGGTVLAKKMMLLK